MTATVTTDSSIMSDAPDDGRYNYWLTIKEAAVALGIGTYRAYQIARAEKWQHTGTKPRGYLAADIRRTAQARREDQR